MAKYKREYLLITKGNTKILSGETRQAATYSIAPIEDVCKTICKGCYACKFYRFHPSCKKAWDFNYHLSNMFPNFWEYLLRLDLDKFQAKGDKKGLQSFFRWHVAGEVYSQAYLDRIKAICKDYPRITFWSYTKRRGDFDFTEIEKLSNMNFINSVLPDGRFNFGTKEEVKQMSEQFKIPICPVTLGHKDVHCVKDCTLCCTCKSVLFVKH